MSNFTLTVKETLHFDGDTIAVEMERPKRSDMLAITPFLKQKDGVTIIAVEDAGALLKLAAEILPSRLRKFKGLTIEGRPAAFEDIVDEAYFLSLIGDLFKMLLLAGEVPSPKASGGKLPAESPALAEEVSNP